MVIFCGWENPWLYGWISLSTILRRISFVMFDWMREYFGGIYHFTFRWAWIPPDYKGKNGIFTLLNKSLKVLPLNSNMIFTFWTERKFFSIQKGTAKHAHTNKPAITIKFFTSIQDTWTVDESPPNKFRGGRVESKSKLRTHYFLDRTFNKNRKTYWSCPADMWREN